jgi:hypothetical protein
VSRRGRATVDAVQAFKGLDTESHPSSRDAGLLQADEGSDHSRPGIWSVRRGWTHANVSKKSAAISALAGMVMRNGDYVLAVAEGVNLRAEPTFDESGSPSSTLLYSSIATNKRPSISVFDRRMYMTDGWKRLQVWDGVGATTQDAGIVGPGQETTSWSPTPTVATASPGIKVGTHLVRYRYLNSQTGYVSEPSNYYTLAAAGGQSAVFNIGDALAAGAAVTNLNVAATTITRGAGDWTATPHFLAVGDYITITNAENAGNNGTFGPITTLTATVITIASAAFTVNADDDTMQIARAARGRINTSSDAKVDRIVVEMTLSGGSTFYKATEVLESASSVTVNISDESLAQNTLLWTGASGSLGLHNLPPITRHVLSFRGRLWAFGQVVHTEGTASVTNNSTTVTGTSTDWSAALGGGSTGLQRHPRFFQVNGETAEYEISQQDSATQLTLKSAYAGSTQADVNYKIYSRDNYIYVSEAGFPESWPLLNFIPGAQRGPTRALVGVLNGLLICADVGMDYFNWTDNPVTEGVRKEASRERGAVSQRVVLNVEERAYGLDQDGMWRFEGVSPEAISKPIETVVRRINWTYSEKFHAVWLPRLRAIRWWVALDSETAPYHYLQFHVDTGSWSTGEREVAVQASEAVPTSGVFGGSKAVVGDENGHVWVDDTGTTDGADSCPKVAATGTPTTTVISVTGATLPTSGTGISGVMAYFPRIGESRVVSSNTASQITLASALSEAPVSSDVIWLGRIKAKLKTKAFSLGGILGKHEARYVHVVFVPLTSQRYALLRIYRDRSSTAEQWGDGEFARRRDEPPRGTTYPEPGSTDYKIDLSTAGGRVKVGLGSEVPWDTEVELEFLEADTPARILAIAVEGVEVESLV